MEDFHKEFSEYVKANDGVNATRLLMQELGAILVQHRKDFIELLHECSIDADDSMTDAKLVEIYMNNVGENKELMLGSALLINMHNKSVGFDGDDEISDQGVKAAYATLYECFCGADGDAQPAKIGLGGLIGGGGLGTAVTEGLKLSGKIADNQHAKKYGATDLAKGKAEAKNQLVQGAIAQRQQQLDAANKKAAEKAKTTKIILIAGGSLLGLAIIGFIIYKVRK